MKSNLFKDFKMRKKTLEAQKEHVLEVFKEHWTKVDELKVMLP